VTLHHIPKFAKLKSKIHCAIPAHNNAIISCIRYFPMCTVEFGVQKNTVYIKHQIQNLEAVTYLKIVPNRFILLQKFLRYGFIPAICYMLIKVSLLESEHKMLQKSIYVSF